MYRYYSNPIGGRRVAVVGEHSKGVLKIAVAICSNKDQFIRVKGRNIAEGRLLKGKCYESIKTKECDTRCFIGHAERIATEAAMSKIIVKPVEKKSMKKKLLSIIGK